MIPTIVFNNVVLQYSYEVTHLGHILTPHLDDKNDIIRAVKDLNRKAFLYFSRSGSVCKVFSFRILLFVIVWFLSLVSFFIIHQAV